MGSNSGQEAATGAGSTSTPAQRAAKAMEHATWRGFAVMLGAFVLGGLANLVVATLTRLGFDALAGPLAGTIGLVAVEAGVVIVAQRQWRSPEPMHSFVEGMAMVVPLLLLGLVPDDRMDALFQSDTSVIWLGVVLAAGALVLTTGLAWHQARRSSQNPGA